MSSTMELPQGILPWPLAPSPLLGFVGNCVMWIQLWQAAHKSLNTETSEFWSCWLHGLAVVEDDLVSKDEIFKYLFLNKVHPSKQAQNGS